MTSQKKKKVCVGGHRPRARMAGLKGEGEARGIGHFQNNKIQHNSESYRTQTMKMNNIWARESPFSPVPRPLSPSSYLTLVTQSREATRSVVYRLVILYPFALSEQKGCLHGEEGVMTPLLVISGTLKLGEGGVLGEICSPLEARSVSDSDRNPWAPVSLVFAAPPIF